MIPSIFRFSRLSMARFNSAIAEDIPAYKNLDNPEPEEWDSKTNLLFNFMTPDQNIVSNLLVDRVHVPGEDGIS